jgi:HK97 gp10 family phage protein
MPRAAINIDASALKGLLNLMEHINDKVKRSGLKKALHEAGALIVTDAKSSVRRKYSILHDSIGSKEKVVLRKGAQFGYSVIGAERRAGRIIGGVERIPTKYSHFVEYGTAAHPTGKNDLTNEILLKRKGAKAKAQGAIHPGSAPFPFLRRAWDSNKTKAIDVMAKVLHDTINEGSS